MAQQPPWVEGDEIFEAYFFDDTPMVRVVMRWWFQVDGVLDPQMLHTSLHRLIEIPTWRRLGGRLRLNRTTNKLEFHIPPAFDRNRPAVRFSHHQIDTSIDSHPVSNFLPKPTPDNKPSVQDYQPPLALQVISFTDSTIVTLNFPHALTDAIGLSFLIKNRCHILANPDSGPGQILPLPQSDPLLQIPPPTEPPLLEKHAITPAKFRILFAFFLGDMMLGPKMSSRMRVLFLPASKIRALMSYYAPESQNKKEEEENKISTGDLLSSITIHSILQTSPHYFLIPRSLTIFNTFELRSRLPSLFPPSQTHIQNAFLTTTTIIPSSQLKSITPTSMAVSLRNSLTQQTTPSQISALISSQRRSLTQRGRPAVYSHLNGFIIPVSNWSKCDLFTLPNFGPAVLLGKKGSGSGTVKMYNAFDADKQTGSRHRNVTNVLGRDQAGNYWIAGTLSDKAWERLVGLVRGVPDLNESREDIAELREAGVPVGMSMKGDLAQEQVEEEGKGGQMKSGQQGDDQIQSSNERKGDDIPQEVPVTEDIRHNVPKGATQVVRKAVPDGWK
ncbi:hypothetical protein QBC43DRAFT_303524 [Cladorrhinum sp. PSN259]|nr:hypothetical protein QBC43DRAFT_303524 [Cladorrhinum sp. PSN259]